jgi:hypothetical protein
LDTGAELVVLGRVRRRFFRSGAGLASRTEVVVDAAAPPGRPARVAAIMQRALTALAPSEAAGSGARPRRPGRGAPI